MASREALRRTALTALATWPKDPLRPTAQLGEVLSARLNATPPQFPGRPSATDASSHDQQQVYAIMSLVTNKYSKKYALDPDRSMTGGMMTPRSNPGYYGELMKDLEEIPTRTWLQRVGIRLKGMIRFS